MKEQAREYTHRELLLFFLIAFGLPYLMGIPLGICQRNGWGTDAFPNAQMFYPAAGAMIALLVTRRGKSGMTRRFYGFFLFMTLVMVACCIGAVAAPAMNWTTICSYAIVIGCIPAWIFLLTEKKQNRHASGLGWHGGWKALLYVLLFIVLRTASVFLSTIPYGQLGEYLSYWATPAPWVILVVLIPNFFFSFTAFFGEEYGWRYYLQPRLQQKFGPRLGVLLLGVLWGAWHLPLNLFYYSPETSLQSFVSQIIACVALGVFFAWAYLKTNNIWVPVLLHYFNNNLIVVYTNSSSISNQVIPWSDVLITLVLYAVLYMPVLASKVFTRRPKILPDSEQPENS